MSSLHADLLVELECPICTNYMIPPILQCSTGHNICKGCREKLQKCPLCQGRFAETRNISLEGLASKIKFPCKFRNDGCNLELSCEFKELHEDSCPFRGYKCIHLGIHGNCKFVGGRDALLEHWKAKPFTRYIMKTHWSGTIKLDKTKSSYINLAEGYGNLFWYKCGIKDQKMYWAVYYVGNASDASDYYYEIMVQDKENRRKKMLFSDVCQPLDLVDEEFPKGVCTFTSLDCLSVFLDKENNFFYSFNLKCSNAEEPNIPPLVPPRESNFIPNKHSHQKFSRHLKHKSGEHHKKEHRDHSNHRNKQK